MSEQIFIQVRFKETVVVNGSSIEFSDALYFSESEYATKQRSEIDALKQARMDNFKYVVEHPAPVVKPTKAELRAQRAEIQKQIDELDVLIGSR